MEKKFIAIGESVHASIPKHAKMMKQLDKLGPDAYTKESEELNYVKNLIESQADEGANYIAVNLDDFGEDDMQKAADLMIEYVKLVRKWGKGVPICIDSSDDNVLITGLKEWFNTDEKIKQPLINSIKVYTMDKMLPLKKDYDFAFVGMLMSEEAAEGPGGYSIKELFNIAETIFDTAIKHGFKPDEIFYDATIFPLAIDMPMDPDVPGYTYRALETMKKIRNTPKMKDVHFAVGVSNCARDLPARKIGICRAFVQKAMEYGLDGGIVNPAHHFGEGGADQDLLELVDAFAKMDGSMEKMTKAMELMGQFCQNNRKPASK